MEKEQIQRRGNLIARRSRFIAAPALAGAVFFGQAAFQSEGHEPSVIPMVSEDQFKPLVIPESSVDDLPDKTKEIIIVENPAPEKTLSKKEIKEQELKEKREYWYELAKASGRFSDNQLKDMGIYLPYYIAAGEKFDVDWRVLYINHQKESGGSAKNSKAFDGSTYPYVGGMQLNINYWTPEYQDRAVEGGQNYRFMEDVFPTRHKGDMESIFAAAKMIGANEDKNGVRFGFVRFTGSLESGEARYQEYKRIKQIFKDQIDEAISSVDDSR